MTTADELEAMRRLDRGPNLRVSAVWFEQGTKREEETGYVSVRLVTDAGHFHASVGRLDQDAYEEAQRLARRLGVGLVVNAPLREMVAKWEAKSRG